MHNDFIKKNMSQNRQEIITPAFIYSIETVINNYRKLREFLGTKLIVSVKANPCAELLQRISHAIVDGYEVASNQELMLVAGLRKDNIYINNPAIELPFLRSAVALKAKIIIDNDAHIEYLTHLIKEKKEIPPVIIRINNSLVQKNYDHFGYDIKSLPKTITRLSTLGVKIFGIHLFNGSNQFIKNAYTIADIMKETVPILETMMGYKLSFINLGGGFSADWGSSKFNFSEYRKKLQEFPDHIELAHESGRGIFTNAGAFVTKVISIKQLNNEFVVICDGGLAQNFMLCQTEQQIKIYKTPYIVSSSTKLTSSEIPIKYVGPSCSQQDVLSVCKQGSDLPNQGDLCVFANCGAYHYTYPMNGFLNLKKATEYVS